jgi:squalene-hopene/tetraprenyl-beta-curcumene cyclase
MDIDREKLTRQLALLIQQLLDKRNAEGLWRGKLSSSALSTSTAVFALAMVNADKHVCFINSGIQWLAADQNPDGGWGDTPDSISNLSTTLLAWAAMTKTDDGEKYAPVIEKLKGYVCEKAGSLQPVQIVKALDSIYGDDRTFSVPILTMCVLAGLLGSDEDAWKYIKPLPFELAAVSPKIFKWLRLPVVSYAIPALIAIGQVNYHFRKPCNPVVRIIRWLTRGKTLKLLDKLQPENGGFLEAVPLTSFVVMSLAGCGNCDSNVVKKGVDFLLQLARSDGSWAIDTDLATWVTTLSVNALSQAKEPVLSDPEKQTIRKWLLDQQHRKLHPYTNAQPGGWGWTDGPGSVPDADDTPGALIALRNLGCIDDEVRSSAMMGIKWLMGLQNKDGGFATFCKGWNKLPFDRSSPDLTSHSLAAMSLWLDDIDESMKIRVRWSMEKAVLFLISDQRQDGAWIPLWFGNQAAVRQANPVYGTSRVLIGLKMLADSFYEDAMPAILKGVDYLVSVQNEDGGFGGDKGVASSIEETALAVDAMAGLFARRKNGLQKKSDRIEKAIAAGSSWLLARLADDKEITPAPIGLYFAMLWYSEELYPLIFAISALQRIENL